MLWTLLVGLVVGAVAKLIMPGKDGGGIILTMLLGVIGAMFAHYVGIGFGWYADNEAAGFFASVIGAVIILAIYRAVTGRNSRLTH